MIVAGKVYATAGLGRIKPLMRGFQYKRLECLRDRRQPFVRTVSDLPSSRAVMSINKVAGSQHPHGPDPKTINNNEWIKLINNIVIYGC